MNNEVINRIRQALGSGPIASAERVEVRLEAARLFDSDLDRAKLVELFVERAGSSGASVHVLESADGLVDTIGKLIPADARTAVDRPDVINARLGCDLLERLGQTIQVVPAHQLDENEMFEIYAAITPVDFAVAETGSIIISAGEGRSRMVSLTAEVHVGLVWVDQIVPDLMDLSDQFAKSYPDGVPTGVNIITGPSKTADIEMNLVIGVHGPAELHLIVLP